MRKYGLAVILLVLALIGTYAHSQSTSSTNFSVPNNHGVYKSYLCADPAAGAEWTCTVPAGKSWRLIALNSRLVTSAVANNRVVAITFDDSANVYYRSSANQNQAASITANYETGSCISAMGGSIGAIGTAFYAPSPCELYLGPGYRIKSVTSLIDVGDDWTAPAVLVEEWPSI